MPLGATRPKFHGRVLLGGSINTELDDIYSGGKKGKGPQVNRAERCTLIDHVMTLEPRAASSG